MRRSRSVEIKDSLEGLARSEVSGGLLFQKRRPVARAAPLQPALDLRDGKTMTRRVFDRGAVPKFEGVILGCIEADFCAMKG